MGIIHKIRTGMLNWLIRANAVGVIPYGFSDNVSKTWRFTDFYNEGYKRNMVVYAGIQKKGTACTAVEVALAQDGEVIPPDEITEDLKPLVKLMTRPNENQSWAEFLKMIVAHLDLAGACYVQGIGIGAEMIGSRKRSKQSPMLRLLRPDSVEVRNDGVRITGYKVQDANRTYELKPEEVCCIRYADPTDEFAGLSPLNACSYSIDASNAALTWNFNLLNKSGVPAGILRVLGMQSLSDKGRDKIQQDFESRYMGPQNAGSVVVINGEDAQYMPLGHSPKDMNWIEGKQDVMRDICMALGVPSKLLGDPAASTYNNVEQAMADFYENTILPLMRLITTELMYYFEQRYMLKGVSMELITDDISALNENENDVVERLAKSDWLTPNEKREALGYDPVDDEVADMIYVRMPGSLQPTQPGEVDPSANAPDEDGVDEEDEARIEKRVNPDPFPHSRYPTLEDRAVRIAKRDEVRKPWNERYKAAVDEYWAGQADRVIETLDKREGRATPPADALPEPVLNPELEAAEYEATVGPLQRGLVIEFGQEAMDEIMRLSGDNSLLFDYERPAFRNWLTENITERSRLINDTTAAKLNEIISETAEQGFRETSKAIREQYSGWTKHRSDAIARTEVARADIRATLEGYKQSGEALGVTISSEWITARDSKVRDGVESEFDHVVMDGKVTNAAGLFETGQVGDIEGPVLSGTAGFDINCRCGISPLLPGDNRI